MPSDQAAPIGMDGGPNWDLPEIAGVQVRYARYKPRPTRHFANPLDAVEDAVEIVVSLKSPAPIRAMAPVLWVGNERLTESEAADKQGKKLRFWSFNRASLQADAPITMSWMNEEKPNLRDAVKFKYRPPKK